MAAEIPTTEPQTIRAGDTVTWEKTLADYPASEFTLSYRLINGANFIDIPTIADGSSHLVEIAASTSDDYVAGQYTWFSFVTKGLERFTLAKGVMTILPDPATATDFRTDAKIILDSLTAAYKSYVESKGHVQSYSIAGRAMTFKSAEEILKQISYWKTQVSAEEAADKIAQGLGTGRKILTRFK